MPKADKSAQHEFGIDNKEEKEIVSKEIRLVILSTLPNGNVEAKNLRI